MRNGENCATDYMIIYDGNSDSSSQFGRYCGGVRATINKLYKSISELYSMARGL